MIDHLVYDAARSRAVWVARPARGRLWLSGPDRATYLQGLLTNDVKAVGAGEGCYAAYLTPQGRMISDMRLHELGDGLLMTLPASTVDVVRDRLERFTFAEDVAVEDRTASSAQVGLHGPAAATWLEHALEPAPGAGPVANLRLFQSVRRRLAGAEVIVAATDELGGGFDLFTQAGAPAATRALEAAGFVEAPREVAEVLRVEAGLPEFGVDMDEETIPLEAGIEHRAISLTKGCFVGQEVIIRVLHRGHGRVARHLVGLTIGAGADPAYVPAAGAELHAENRQVGRITSAVQSPALSCTVALGYVHRDFVEVGTRLRLAHGDATLSAIVTKLPFVS